MDVTREIKGIPKVAHSICPPEFFPPPLSFLRVIERILFPRLGVYEVGKGS